MKRKFMFALIFIALLMFLSLISTNSSCFAKINSYNLILEPDHVNLKRKEKFSVATKLESSKLIKLCVLNTSVKFDYGKFTLEGVRTPLSNKISLKRGKSNDENLIFFNAPEGFSCPKGTSDEIFILDFIVKNDTEYGMSEIIPEVILGYDDNENLSEIIPEVILGYDDNENPIEIKNKSSSVNIVPPDISTCELSNLVPSVGSLNPQFNSQTYNYTLEVPHDIKDVAFDFSSKNPDSDVQINKHKLNPAGGATNIKISVSNQEEKTKLIYNVKVNRLPVPSKETGDKNKKSKIEASFKARFSSSFKVKRSASEGNEKPKISPNKESANSGNKKYEAEYCLDENDEGNENYETQNFNDDIEEYDDENENFEENTYENHEENNNEDTDEPVIENKEVQNNSDKDNLPYKEPNKNRYVLILISMIIVTLSCFAYSSLKILKASKHII